MLVLPSVCDLTYDGRESISGRCLRMIKKISAYLSFLLLIGTGLLTMYSFVFPFEAGHPTQGLWFASILLGGPVGFFVGIAGLGARFPMEGRWRHGKTIAWTAVIGNGGMLLFLFLYMTFGYVLWGV